MARGCSGRGRTAWTPGEGRGHRPHLRSVCVARVCARALWGGGAHAQLSTFERYATEVSSGQLKWGLVHTEKFWRENARSVEANDFALLKVPQ